MTPFAERLLEWYDEYGRHDLPWQHEPTAYRVWVSEIMLQQTQVTTVIPYYEGFMARFPALGDLAAAPQDEVLSLWSGLGYYARARNLHLAAQRIVDEHGGTLPTDIETLMGLPGIGRSTAGAILALAHGERHPILDGNARRVLARFHAVEGWPGRSAVGRRLWDLAETHTPAERVADYTQAIMDLGATLCTRGRPACVRCPQRDECRALKLGRTQDFPGRKPRGKERRRRIAQVVLAWDGEAVLLERRPSAGIWGGLWSLPEVPGGEEPEDWCRRESGLRLQEIEYLDRMEHSFTHFDLELHPVLMQVKREIGAVADADDRIWYRPEAPADVGLPAPVTRLIAMLPARDAERETDR